MRETAIVIGAASGTDECPFRGLHSYDMDRSGSFKGRERETVELAQRILGSRLTVLTGGSGDGKTSLIHAGLAPLLLEEGYEVVVTEPGGGEPVRNVAEALLERLTPLSSANILLIEWLTENVGGGSLRESRNRLLEERRAGERRSPWQVQRPIDVFRGGPLWTWLISERCGDALLDQSMEALAAMASPGRAAAIAWPGLDADLIDVRGFYQKVGTRLGRRWLENDDAPMDMLDSALEAMGQVMASRSQDPAFGLILFVDQFEEIFTQYGGLVAVGDAVQPWRHKQALLDLILEIKECQEWPVRIVLSMRKEHYADLQAALPDQESLAANTYHLAPLRKEQALFALSQLSPVASRRGKAGATVSDADIQERWSVFLHEAADALVAEREAKWVDATELSSFGTWLWRRPIPEDAEQAVAFALTGQVREILDLKQGDEIISTPARRQEALDLLFALIISTEGGQGRRISLPKPALEAPPWRSAQLREEMLQYLVRTKLLRTDRKDAHLYYEIVHERIISVIDELGREWHDPLLGDLGRVLPPLRERCFASPFEPVSMSHYELRVLAANLERLDLSDFAAARLLDGILKAWDWSPESEESDCVRDVLKHLVRIARREAELVTPELAHNLARKRMAGEELASPALALAISPSVRGISDEELASWLVLSSLMFVDVSRDGLETWARILRERPRHE